MKLTQLKHWLKSGQGEVPKCVLTSYAGQSEYLMEVEFKHQLEPLRDDEDKMVKFQTIEQVSELLKPLGVESVTLRIIDPYDEFSDDRGVDRCQEDMQIAL